MKTISIHNFLYEIIYSWGKALARAQAPMKTISIYNFLYEIISSWDKTIQTINFCMRYYLLGTRRLRAQAPMKTIIIYHFLTDIQRKPDNRKQVSLPICIILHMSLYDYASFLLSGFLCIIFLCQDCKNYDNL